MAKTSAIALRQSHNKPKAGKRKLVELSFEPAEGGVISRTRHRTESDEFSPSESHTSVHTSKEDAAEHLLTTLEGCFPEGKEKTGPHSTTMEGFFEGDGKGNKPAQGKSSEK